MNSSTPISPSSRPPNLEEELAKAEFERDKRRCERSLYDFVVAAWPAITRRPMKNNWHIKAICKVLEQVTRGELKRVIINIPPRCMKSSIVSVFWPVWGWLHRPDLEVMSISHKLTLSTRDTVKSRRLIQSPWFQTRWGDRFMLATDQNQKMRYENNQGGVRLAQGMDSGITGEGGDVIVVDDPHNRKQAQSEVERTRGLETFDEEISTRLNDPESGAIVIIMQRLHSLDLTGHVLASGDPWRHVVFPMEFEPERADILDERKEPGELLWPDRFTPEALARLKLRLGAYGTAGQLQQRPAPRGGGIWKDAFLKSYRIEGSRAITPERSQQINEMHRFNVADLAYSAKQSADYTVIGSFAGDAGTGNLYLTDVFKARIDALNTQEGAEHRHYIRQQRQRASAQYTAIEATALATRIIEFLRREGEPVVGIEADRDKVSRAYAALPLCEAGNVHVPMDAPWWPQCSAELSAFPNGEHDDFADVLAYACIHWRDILTAGNDEMYGAVESAFMRPSIH